MDPLFCEDDDELNGQLNVEQKNETYFYDVSSGNALTTKWPFKNKQISTTSNAAAICKIDRIYTNSVASGFFMKGIIVK